MNGYEMATWLYQQWRAELADIERREFCEPLDHTRAAIIRSCMRREQVALIQHQGQS